MNLLLVFRCSNQTKFVPISTITISGYLPNTKAKKISIGSGINFYHGSIASRNIYNDSVNFVFDLLKPEIVDIYSVGAFEISNKIYIKPGDSVVFEIVNGKPKFKGKNKVEHDFSNVVNQKKIFYPKYDGDLSNFLKKCDTIFSQKNKLLLDYSNINKVNKDFIAKFKDEYRAEYVFKLISPIVFNQTEDVNTLKKHILIDFDQELQRKDLLGSLYFKNNLKYYIRYYYNDFDGSFSKEQFDNATTFINKNLQGKLKEYALASVIETYSKRLLPNTIDGLKDLIENNNFTVESYRAEVQKVNILLSKLNNKIPFVVGNIELKELSDSSYPLQTILDSNTKIKVIDFWASWCGPCIDEIKISDSFRKQLTERYGVQWIYISTDTEEVKWKNRAKELSVFGLLKNQYIIIDANKDNPIVKYFNLETIPHYTIFNQKGKMLLDNASRPSDSIFFERVIKQIYEAGKKL